MRRERDYQAVLISRIKLMFPGCVVLKNDTDYIQGIPDLTILYEDKWAMLEVKAGKIRGEQPNQSYYIDKLDLMSFAAFIFPENEEAVLDALQRTFKPGRSTRVSQR